MGGLHALVNNAGIGSLATVEDETTERWEQVIAVDQTSVWLGMKYAGALIERSGGGAIVNMSSILGTVGGFGSSFAYHAAKGAVRTMTKSAAAALGDQGGPGQLTAPRLHRHRPAAGAVRGFRTSPGHARRHPDGPARDRTEIAAVVAFLASDDASS